MTAEPEIVPRWEWRTFGAEFGLADRVLGEYTPDEVPESDEVYLVSVHTERAGQAPRRASRRETPRADR